MTRTAISAAVVAGMAGGLAGGVSGGVGPAFVGLAVGAGVGLATGGVAARRERRRLHQVARDVRRWLTAEPAHRTVVLRGDAAWRDLGTALNAVGAELDRRRDERRERPWQHDLVESLAGPALLFDGDGYLVAANRRARELFGIAAEGATATVLQALGNAVLADAVARAHDGHTQVEVDAEVGDRQVRASISVVADETLVIVSDRTHERRVEELRRNFVVNASHELKTPATSIQTLSEALEITAVDHPERVPDLVARLREESERLVRLVHDLLNLRRLEERGEVVRVPLDLVEQTREVIADLQPRARRRGITLSLDAPEHARLAGDPDDLRLVIRNLVANAIQYNRDGGRVDVTVRADAQRVVVEVADTGIGIPRQDLQRIFQRFYRVDVARSRETGGTGLGLSIVRHAVERHRGTIRVDSLLGEGATFTVTLPVAEPPPAAS